jgi:hypothetical protein
VRVGVGAGGTESEDRGGGSSLAGVLWAAGEGRTQTVIAATSAASPCGVVV